MWLLPPPPLLLLLLGGCAQAGDEPDDQATDEPGDRDPPDDTGAPAEVTVAGGTQPGAAQVVADRQELASDGVDIAAGEVDGDPVGGAPRAFWAERIEAGRAAPDHLAATSAPALVLGR